MLCRRWFWRRGWDVGEGPVVPVGEAIHQPIAYRGNSRAARLRNACSPYAVGGAERVVGGNRERISQTAADKSGLVRIGVIGMHGIQIQVIVAGVHIVAADEELILAVGGRDVGILVSRQQAVVIGRELEANLFRRFVTYQQLCAVIRTNLCTNKLAAAGAEVVHGLEITAGPYSILGIIREARAQRERIQVIGSQRIVRLRNRDTGSVGVDEHVLRQQPPLGRSVPLSNDVTVIVVRADTAEARPYRVAL